MQEINGVGGCATDMETEHSGCVRGAEQCRGQVNHEGDE